MSVIPLSAQAKTFSQRLFDQAFYLNNNDDVFKAVSLGLTTAFEHFSTFGHREIRPLLPFFDTQAYLTANLDVAGATKDPGWVSAWNHFVIFGILEGRSPNGTAGFSGLFDNAKYLQQNQDVDTAVSNGAFRNGFEHYLLFGAKEGRAAFNTAGNAIDLASSVTPGKIFTLTTGPDNIVGTSGNDTIIAYINTNTGSTTTTLTGADVIDGGGGIDTLKLTVEGANAAGSLTAATIKNVENFFIRDLNTFGPSIYNFATVSGEKQVWNDRSTQTVTFDNLGTGTIVGIKGDNANNVSNTKFTMATATDPVTIAIDGGVKGSPNITRNQTGQAAVTITSTGATNEIGTIDLDTGTTINSVTIDAATKLTATLSAADYASGATLTLKGAGFIDLSGAALAANITTVNAAGSTGGVHVIMGANTTTFIGGAGDDTVNANGFVFNSTGSLNGGGGTNTLVLKDQSQLTAATAAKMTNFQVLRLNDDNDNNLDTFNSSLLSGLIGLVIGSQSAGDGVSVTNMSAALAGNVTIAGDQVVGPTFGITGATNVGQLDTLSIKIDDGLTAQNTLTIANITAAGVETIKIATVDHFTLSAATGLTGMTKMEFSGSGNVDVTTGALPLNMNTIIDASALNGTFTFDASGATVNGLAIIGSSTKANTITGTAQDDVITGGTGVDKVIYTSGNANGDTVDFVSDSAADEIEFGANVSLTSKTVTIINFDAATATTTEDLVNVSNDDVDGGEIQITAAATASAIVDDRTYVIEQAVGSAGALTIGGTATITDFTNTTQVAAYLSERFIAGSNQKAMIFLNNGVNTYAYYVEDSGGATIAASEINLVGVFIGAVLNAGDIYQS